MDRLLTVSETAALLGTTSKAIYSRLHRGQIASPIVVRLGRSVRFRESQVLKLMRTGHGPAVRGRKFQNKERGRVLPRIQGGVN